MNPQAPPFNPKQIKCPHCHGTGWFQSFLSTDPRQRRCHLCQGGGANFPTNQLNPVTGNIETVYHCRQCRQWIDRKRLKTSTKFFAKTTSVSDFDLLFI